MEHYPVASISLPQIPGVVVCTHDLTAAQKSSLLIWIYGEGLFRPGCAVAILKKCNQLYKPFTHWRNLVSPLMTFFLASLACLSFTVIRTSDEHSSLKVRDLQIEECTNVPGLQNEKFWVLISSKFGSGVWLKHNQWRDGAEPPRFYPAEQRWSRLCPAGPKILGWSPSHHCSSLNSFPPGHRTGCPRTASILTAKPVFCCSAAKPSGFECLLKQNLIKQCNEVPFLLRRWSPCLRWAQGGLSTSNIAESRDRLQSVALGSLKHLLHRQEGWTLELLFLRC